MLTIEQIIKLRPGLELDRAIHEHLFSRTGRPHKYSTTHAALEILDAVPMQVERLREADPEFKPERPFRCRFQLGPIEEPDERSVTAATAPVALCKAALIRLVVSTPAPNADTASQG